MDLWVAGRFLEKGSTAASVWELIGIFDDISKAEDACLNDHYFVGPATLNKVLSGEHELVEWYGLYYPNLVDKE